VRLLLSIRWRPRVLREMREIRPLAPAPASAKCLFGEHLIRLFEFHATNTLGEYAQVRNSPV
jgi:hypothetical protein